MSIAIRPGRAFRVLIALLLVGLVAAGGCGDDDAGPMEPAGSSAAGRGGGKDAGTAGTADSGSVDPKPEPASCDVTPPASCPDPEPTYADDVKPIIAARCLSCHDGKGEQWPLVSESHVASWFIQIRDAMVKCAMPPADSGITMPAEERETILAWLRCKF